MPLAHLSPELDVPAQWWQAFRSEPLNALVTQSLAGNPTIEAADAALRAAQENEAADRAAFWPSVALGYSPTRQRVASAVASPVSSNANLYTLHTAQVTVSYTPDAFGATRRQVEGCAGADRAAALPEPGREAHAEQQRGGRRDHRSLSARAATRHAGNRRGAERSAAGLSQAAGAGAGGAGRRRCARSLAGRNRGHAAAARQATRAAAQPAGHAGRPLPERRRGGAFRSRCPATARGVAADPAIQPGRAPA